MYDSGRTIIFIGVMESFTGFLLIQRILSIEIHTFLILVIKFLDDSFWLPLDFLKSRQNTNIVLSDKCFFVNGILEDERLAEDDDEFAVSSRPKQLRDDVVRSAVKTVDDFSKIASLKDRKGDWENTAKEAIVSVERKMNAGEEIVAGKVKANLERFVTRGVNDEVDDEQNEDDEERDPNIIREDKKYKEELKFDQVGDIKNRWKTGNIQGADIKEICKEDLEELKRGPGLKDRFKERNESDEDVKQIRQWDQNEIDKSRAADARRSFLEGSAFQTGPVEKNKEIADMEFKRLDEFKERFEKGEGDSAIEKTAIDVQIDSLSDKKSAFEKVESKEICDNATTLMVVDEERALTTDGDAL
ncbi:unnamed protein product [Dracunculus medinensis]|uniref:Uncharacterized protein n=1 Tax=Dracunculus medinensis TaxID=318479 RepID=A0A0N4U3S4_DRAME|nr:unnamed protein product [Dracunculus medinensis]